MGSPDRAVGHTLHVEPDGSFSITAVVWRPGQFTRIHDHTTWCVFGVVQGVEHEDIYDADLNLIGSSDGMLGDVNGFARRGTSTGSTTPAPGDGRPAGRRPLRLVGSIGQYENIWRMADARGPEWRPTPWLSGSADRPSTRSPWAMPMVCRSLTRLAS